MCCCASCLAIAAANAADVAGSARDEVPRAAVATPAARARSPLTTVKAVLVAVGLLPNVERISRTARDGPRRSDR
jgi:hypothetical protein